MSCELLDEMPLLGRFVEIEGPSEQEVTEMRKALGLENQPLITMSYIAMLGEYLKRHGMAVTEVRFPS